MRDMTATFRSTLEKDAESVAFAIEVALREARSYPAPILHMNADGLVIEYNSASTGAKIFEKLSRLETNNS